jgi:hypothetical protein
LKKNAENILALLAKKNWGSFFCPGFEKLEK